MRSHLSAVSCLLFPASCFLVCLVFGCESGLGSQVQGDPFMGVRAAPKATQTVGVPNNPPIQPASGPIPAMPSSNSAPGTAPIAGGETATPESSREMRIPGDPVSPASLPSAGAARGAAPAVNIGNPEPAQTGTTANLPMTPASAGLGMPAPAPAPTGGTADNIRTYEDAQRILKQHGVSWQRMSGEGDDWNFSCGIPNPSNPHINRTYQTSRPFPDLLSAMRAVIAQIEQTPH
jgi:hypothetical protein